MRQQIRLVISPAQIASVISALESSANADIQAAAFLRYLKGKQFSISQGQTAVAYTAKQSKQSLTDSLGFDTTVSASLINPENVADYAMRIAAGETIPGLSDIDKEEIKTYLSIMMMPIPDNF